MALIYSPALFNLLQKKTPRIYEGLSVLVILRTLVERLYRVLLATIDAGGAYRHASERATTKNESRPLPLCS